MKINHPIVDTPIIVDLTDEKVYETSSITQHDTVEIWIPDDEESQEILGVIDNNSPIIQNNHSHIRPSNLFHHDIIPIELFTRHPTTISTRQRQASFATPERILQRARIANTRHNRIFNRYLSRMASRTIDNNLSRSHQYTDEIDRTHSTNTISYLFDNNYENDNQDSISDNLLSDYDAMWELADTLGYVKHRGASNISISSIPTIYYSPSSNSLALDSKECSICLYEFSCGDKMKRMPSCLHAFHPECLDKWLKVNATCPICRISLL